MKFYNSYIDLGEPFFQRGLPQKVASPKLLLWNAELANSLFITPAQQENHALLAQYFSGNELPEGAESIALAYSGHQFGHFNPNLGDGRAHLLGEVIDKEGIRRDVQLKGSGQTAFSRRGDGKCALAPALREYIMSEALYALEVPTSRCLAVVSTGEIINRGLAKAGAVVTRVAASHIRVGSFQYFAARGDIKSLKSLFNYSIERHFPEINSAELSDVASHEFSEEQRIIQFLECTINKQITLITQWLRIGFIHGVMNTDNTAICGETIDFGPCAMMGSYDEKAVFSSIDEYGRYAFGNQGKIGQWNMARLADCLLLLLVDLKGIENSEEEIKQHTLEKIETVIQQYTSKFDEAYYVMYANKLGMKEVNLGNKTVINDLLAIMQAQSLDYTQTFHLITKSLTGSIKVKELPAKLGDWYKTWIAQLKELKITKQDAEELMTKNNPVVIPRNHHIEALLARCEQAFTDSGIDNSNNNKNAANKQTVITDIVDEFLHVLRSPYQEIDATKQYQDTPKDNDQYYQTFCGT